MGTGYLQIHLFFGEEVLPVGNTKVSIKDTKGNVIYDLEADENGVTTKVSLEAPDRNHSIDPYYTRPIFAIYDVDVHPIDNCKKIIIHGVQIFDGEKSILPIQVHPAIIGDTPEQNTEEIFIPIEHGVDEPRQTPAIMDPELPAPDNFNTSEQVVANEVQIPYYITVHLGSPNAMASNVRVPFIDYIKNVASSEIFPTWHESALYANIYAQISFALNRIYTVWYRSRGYDFDITNSTAFDQYFVYGRNIFENISHIVDGIFNMFLRRPGRREPFFASYCNGTTATCAGLSQWGSQDLAMRGYTPIQILHYYYPNDIQIVESNNFTSEVGTFPGVPLREGSSGNDVRTMQLYLNRISGNFYIPPISPPNGNFGATTKTTTTEFQSIFELFPDGIIGKNTWYRITMIYVGVKQLAELTSEGERISVGQSPPTVTIQVGARGEYVAELQFLLNFISEFFSAVPFVVQDSVIRESTKRSVTEFQKEFGLTADGIVGPATWRELYDVYHSIMKAIEDHPHPSPGVPQFPGTALQIGSRGDSVLLMQNYLNAIAKSYPSIPTLVADGIFGSATQAAVLAFQRLFGLTQDGIIGRNTWDKIVSVYNGLSSPSTPQFPGTALRIGSRGDDVRLMQGYLSAISRIFPAIPTLTADGIFGTGTQASVIAFQKLFGLTQDGVIGSITWNEIVNVFNNLPDIVPPEFPGSSLRVGSRGNDVIIMQRYLNSIADRYSSIPRLIADGIFGAATEQAVTVFQTLFGLTADGIIGRNTWNQIVSVYNTTLMNNLSMYSTTSIKHGGGQNFNQYAMMFALCMIKRYLYS